MIGRILKATAGKPCSCPEGKICEGCKKKRIVKPQVYIEEPRRLTVPIVISHYRDKPSTTVQIVEKPRRWSIRKKQSVKKTTLCQWYKRHKALNELKNDYQKEKKREKQERLERAKRERETEVLEYLKLQAAVTPVIEKEQKNVFVKKHKPKRVKARTTSARPRAESKFVSVKRNRYESLSTRFVNCCYRICCQFYCYLSCIFIIGFIIIYFL